jgi:DNA polymerase-3 subunit beta
MLSTAAILAHFDNFLFELDNNELTVSASDLETTMSNLAIDSTSKEVLPYRQNYYWRSLKLSGTTVNFTVEENSTMEISSNSGKYALAYAPGDEFQNQLAWKTLLLL